jgi:SAM-dependent methyltransferase
MGDTLREHLQVWDNKPAARLIYRDMFERIAAACCPGPTLEIGAGIGKLKERLPDVTSSDIQFSPWLDLVADAQNLPFREGTFGNIVMVDVLHHVEFPIKFLRTASQVLKPGGRLIMVEPAITWGSAFFYRCLHQEPVDMSADIFADGVPDPARDPYAANQAIPTLLARRTDRFHQLIPDLRVIQVSWFSFAVYPLSGGFKRWTLVGEKVAQKGIALERRLEGLLGRRLGFRMLIVIERQAPRIED